MDAREADRRYEHRDATPMRHFFSRDRLFAWGVLIAIPFVYLGWTLGRVGLVLDDWFIWHAVSTHQWYGIDNLRPIAAYPMALLHAFTDMNVVAIFAGLFLVHGIAAIALYEVSRHLLARVLPDDAPYLALLVAAIFVLYPSDVSRLWLLASFGARWVCIEACVVALFWIIALERNRPAYVVGAGIVAASALLRAESDVVIFAVLPLMTLLYLSTVWPARWKWIATAAVWYGVMVAYLFWHFHTMPEWAFGHFGTNGVDIRPLHRQSFWQLIFAILVSFAAMTKDVVQWTIWERDAAVRTHHTAIMTLAPYGAIAGALVVLGAWFTTYRGWKVSPRPNFSARRWAIATLVAAVFTSAGMLPFILNGYNETGFIIVTGILSRYSAVAAMGMSAFLVCLALIPIARTRAWPVNLIVAGLVCVGVLTTALVRQVHTAEDYVAAWSQQKSEWRAILFRNGYWQRGSAIMYHNFPVYVNLAPMANQSWAIRNALEMFLEPPPTPSMYLSLAPDDMRIYPDNAGEASDWRIERDRVTMKWFAVKQRLSFPIQDFVALDYDWKLDAIAPMTTFPLDDLSGRMKRIPIYTGPNRLMPNRRLSWIAKSMFAPWLLPRRCSSVVEVRTTDDAPVDGAATIVNERGDVIERRFVSRGENVDFSYYGICNARQRLYFEASEPGELTDRSPLGRYMPNASGEYRVSKNDKSQPYVARFGTAPHA